MNVREGKWKLYLIGMTLMMLLGITWASADSVYAADGIGTITYGGSVTSYEKIGDLKSDLENKYEGKTITITMNQNWEGKNFNQCLVIPEKAKVTFEMNGHAFNRDRVNEKGWQNSGGLFWMKDGSKLTVNGGSRSESHNVWAFNSAENGKHATTSKTVYGGTLTGGSSTDSGGAVEMREGATLILNDVTIVGCRAESSWGSDGYGGGIHVDKANCTIRMNNSSITGCYSECGGGGLADDHGRATIELDASHIDGNYSTDGGGGVYFDDSYVTEDGNSYLSGRNGSSINNNVTKANGGGVWYDGTGCSVSGVEINNNRAVYGGGVYFGNTINSLSNDTLSGNYASEKGGGIYVGKKKTTLSGLTVTGNDANVTGDGVYIDSDIDEKLVVSGSTVIRENNGQNLYISDNDPEDTRVTFRLTRGADVVVDYWNWGEDLDTINVTPDGVKVSDCTRYLTAANGNYHFEFESDPDARRIVRKKGAKPAGAKIEVISSAEALPKSNKLVGAGGGAGSEYKLIRGYLTHEKTDSSNEDTENVFYYSDAFFDADPTVYNEHLATASWNLAFAGTYLRKFEEDGNTYYNKHGGARQFLADIGCDDQSIYVNDSNVSKPETDSIGVSIASKELAKADGTKTGKILIPVTVRGGGYESEWASNVTLGKSGEAQGFSEAAGQVMKEIDKYIDRQDLRTKLEKGDVKFWVTGFSRAGATANLTSKRLIEKYGDKNQIFGYPCEAPKGGVDKAEELDASAYYSIHNLINKIDVVPYVGPEQMGFKRYGVDHYIPGTNAGTVKATQKKVQRGETTNLMVTTYADNEPVYTKTDAYNARVEEMRTQLKAIDSEMEFDDYFHPTSITFVTLGERFNEQGSYADNRVEYFVEDFIRVLQEGADPDDPDHYSQAVNSRERWVNELQPAMRNTMSLLFSMSDENSAGFIDRASTIGGKISTILSTDPTMFSIWANAVGSWHDLDNLSRNKYTTYLWDKIEDSGALDYLTTDQRSKLKNDWPTLADMLFRLLDFDYRYNPDDQDDDVKNELTKGWTKGVDHQTMYLGTFATFSNYILSNHYPEINMAWARTYDDYYQSETRAYQIGAKASSDAPIGVDAPTASVDGTKLKAGKDEENTIQRGDSIKLDVENISGEAIYYDLESLSDNGKKLASNQIYRGKVDLVDSTDTGSKRYRIQTYAMSYGVKSASVTYNVTVHSNKHRVIVEDGEDDLTYVYTEGSRVVVTANTPSNAVFKNWKLQVLNDGGEQVGDEKVLDDQGENITLEMPIIGGEIEGIEVPDGYQIKLTAVYVKRITELKLQVPDDPSKGTVRPITDSHLMTNWTFDATDASGKTSEVRGDITWTFKSGGADIVESKSLARAGAVYTATMKISADVKEGIAFAKTVNVSSAEGQVVESTVRRSDADGSVTVAITFDATEGTFVPVTQPVELTIKAYDLGKQDYDSAETKINVMSNTEIVLNAPEVEGKQFVRWNSSKGESLDGTKITLIEGDPTDSSIRVKIEEDVDPNTTIVVSYVPAVRDIDVELEEPLAGESLDQDANMVVTIDGKYEIKSDYLNVNWYPSASTEGAAEAGVAYTAEVTLKPDKDYNIEMRAVGDTEWSKEVATFAYTDDLSASVNGESTSFDKAYQRLYYTFGPTKINLRSVGELTAIKDLTHDMNNAASIMELLPKSVELVLDDGSIVGSDGIEWETPTSDAADPRAAATWTAVGTVKLPENVNNPDKVSLEVMCSAYVLAADKAAMPTAELESGAYLRSQETILSTEEEDGQIRYTTDGTDPANSETATTYDGETIQIPLDADHTEFHIKAITVKDGKYDSDIAEYTYTRKTTISVPSAEDNIRYNGESQVGIAASAYYTIEPISQGATLDEGGNAVATGSGNYEVNLKIKDGYQWIIPAVNEGNEDTTTTADQKVTFQIKPSGMILNPIEDMVYNGQVQTPDLNVTDTEGKALKEGDYTITLGEGRLNVGTYSVTVTGVGDYADMTASGEFTITSRDLTASGSIDPIIDQIWAGSPIEPPVLVKDGVTTLDSNTDYDVNYINNDKLASALDENPPTVVVTLKGNYSGTLTRAFSIVKGADEQAAEAVSTLIEAEKEAKAQAEAEAKAKAEEAQKILQEQKAFAASKPSLVKVAAKKKSAKVTWKKVAGVKGYKIQYSLNKSFKKAKKYGTKTVTIKSGTAVSKSIKKLKSKKKYYFRVSAYKSIGGKTINSKWSTAKKAKIK